MTSRNFANAVKKIEGARSHGFYLEAMVYGFHVNTTLLKDLLKHSGLTNLRKKKAKSLYKLFFRESKNNEKLRALISRQSARQVRTWIERTDDFFKALKNGPPASTRILLEETLKITGILNISAAKLPARTRRQPAVKPTARAARSI